MDSRNSFKSYSKVDEEAEAAFRKKTRKRLIIIVTCSIVLVTIIIGAVAGTLVGSNKTKGDSISSKISSAESIKAACNVTLYPDSCYSSMSSALKASSNNTNTNLNDPKELLSLSLQVALNELQRISLLPQQIMNSQTYKNETNDTLVGSSLLDCEALFLDAVDRVNESISTIQLGKRSLTSGINDIRTWLSTAMTDQDTCIGGLEETRRQLILVDELRYTMTNSTEFTSNSLAIASNLQTILEGLHIPIHRKVLGVDHDHELVGEFPEWVNGGDRRMLQGGDLKPNLIVAKDGSGDFKTISDAVSMIPKQSESRFVVYVKEGVYLENVNLDQDYWNVMIYGDGMNKTIVSASLNYVDNVPTYSSGTFIAEGRGFIAKDMGFKNTAGPQKEQAVAFRSSSDQSVFYRCSFDAYQDTLYTHSNRQFYRDCQITGTIDFIFGNAAVVFQNCTIRPRQPMKKQFNTITAQGKTDPNQNTGISIQRCQFTPLDNLTAPTYLGRPWKDYATTVIMQSHIASFLDPEGWSPWDSNTDPPSTIFYGEYQNVGRGSRIDKRVGWPGVRPNMTYAEAAEFAVEPFIQGSGWLPQASVMYELEF
ncbi:hypothetical protein Tsubulata_926172 [Turnera subulata]|uniref:Pectinesterase n=1 Tax=Turnera subulata TaxID=218843 RepID=A0A9Q0GFZ4_9ROSI|nr:hypothetical protein Tsubulata_926172 [Turnera subulata]